jgi:hypothetical protein
MNDTLWITLPVKTWRKLFDRASKEDRDASDFLRILIERGELIHNPAPQAEE